jgi:hypothetical protein
MSGASFMLTLACPKVPWFCSLEFHELQGGKGPQYGYGTNREAAMKAFCPSNQPSSKNMHPYMNPCPAMIPSALNSPALASRK